MLVEPYKVMPKVIFLIFTVALFVRFLYFPDNINFAYDQARDSFAALDILKGNFKVVGPPTTAGGNIFHGAGIYYVLAPIYFISGNNPEVAVAIFRVVNALGVFLVFYVGSLIFGKVVGILSAFLFAVSFEQSQYSLFFGHPALGDFTVLIFYLGLTLWIFQNRPIGFVIALLGLGLTLQFEDANLTLILSLITYLLIFHKNLKLLNFKTISLGIVAFLVATSTFILSEIKYHFRMSQALLNIASHLGNNSSFNPVYLITAWERFIHDNFLANKFLSPFILLFLGICVAVMIKKKDLRVKTIFLSTWFLGGMIPHLLNPSFTYYYSPGATVSLLILAAFLICQLFRKNKILATIIFGVIIFSNLSLVISQNYKGPNSDIVIQPGMLTVSQKQVLDFIYQKAEGQTFSVSALTVPLNVKTTWDYLFNWYGAIKYHYLPVWIGAADGFPGNLRVETNRSKLPNKQFTIIEPTIGIGQRQVEDFYRIENYFTKVIEERSFGTIKVQERERI